VCGELIAAIARQYQKTAPAESSAVLIASPSPSTSPSPSPSVAVAVALLRSPIGPLEKTILRNEVAGRFVLVYA
jgi:hypothetical protein